MLAQTAPPREVEAPSSTPPLHNALRCYFDTELFPLTRGRRMIVSPAFVSISALQAGAARSTSRCFTTTLHAQKQAFNPKRHSDELRAWLKENGALDHKWPAQIRAERYVVGSPRPTEANKKVVHFQRHGQGYHNLIYTMMSDFGSPVEDIYDTDPKRNPFVRSELADSPLTSLGREQCLEKRELANSLNPELIVVSPLHRAIQTAQLTFAEFMGDVRFVGHDLCREELGLLVCNKRRPLSETSREFPHVDFSMTSGEEDRLWMPDEREAPLDKSKRIYNFLADYIQHRPEKEIAVVGHSAYFFNMCNAVLDCGDDEEIKKWFGTSEIRSLVLTFDDAVPDE